MHIDELWEAFIEHDMKLTLKVQSQETVDLVRRGLSNYKHKLYAKDPEIEELFGSWRFKFEVVEKAYADRETSWQLKISTTQEDKSSLPIEIVEEDKDNGKT